MDIGVTIEIIRARVVTLVIIARIATVINMTIINSPLANLLLGFSVPCRGPELFPKNISDVGFSFRFLMRGAFAETSRGVRVVRAV